MPKIPKAVKVIQEHKLPKLNKEEDKSVSYSQYLSYATCPHQWYLKYVRNLGSYEPSIHTVFGTAMHSVIQDWLEVMYSTTIKEAMQMDLNTMLRDKMTSTYKQEKYRAGHEHFSNPLEMESFYNDGVQILDFLKKKRGYYFSTKNTYLVGVEIPLLHPLRKGVYFKGFIDLVFFNELLNKFYIVDIKTSTSGWNKWAKQDEKKLSQLVLYKEYFAEQFNVDVESIDITYFIIKRKVPDDPEYPAMGKRVQEFSPASGKIKRGKVKRDLFTFIEDGFDNEGNYLEKDYLKNASKSSCRFCEFRENKYLCNQAVF